MRRHACFPVFVVTLFLALWAFEAGALTSARGQAPTERPPRRVHPVLAAPGGVPADPAPSGVLAEARVLAVRVPQGSIETGGERWGSDVVVKDDPYHE